MKPRSNLGKDYLPGKRQTRYSQKIRQMGRCWCGSPTAGKSLCGKHLKLQAQRMKSRRAA
jgi:hypothetical protein